MPTIAELIGNVAVSRLAQSVDRVCQCGKAKSPAYPFCPSCSGRNRAEWADINLAAELPPTRLEREYSQLRQRENA